MSSKYDEGVAKQSAIEESNLLLVTENNLLKKQDVYFAKSSTTSKLKY